MRSRRLLYLNLILVVLYLAGLQTWFRWQGDTQRVAAVAIMVLGLFVVGLHVLVLLGTAIFYRVRRDHELAGEIARAAIAVVLGGLILSYASGVVVQL